VQHPIAEGYVPERARSLISGCLIVLETRVQHSSGARLSVQILHAVLPEALHQESPQITFRAPKRVVASRQPAIVFCHLLTELWVFQHFSCPLYRSVRDLTIKPADLQPNWLSICGANGVVVDDK
jgi:hypothetical protein